MIVLYVFGRRYGLPDPSPFVSKAEVLLKMAGLDYRRDETGFGKAPKGKLPYIDDNGTRVADSAFIRFHLEERHGIDFDKGLTPEQRAVAWALERMCEEHLYWLLMHNRWVIDENFDKGARTFFDHMSFPMRPFIIAMVRRQYRSALKAQGLGRHSIAEMDRLAARDIETVAAVLGDKPWLMGDAPTGVDACVWSFVATLLCPLFEGGARRSGEKHRNLMAYRDRGMQRWFPELIAEATAKPNVGGPSAAVTSPPA
jgi:glutathione S-transferase